MSPTGVSLGVLASGKGTILEALCASGLPLSLVVVDRPCRALEVAQAAGLEAAMLDRAGFGRGEAFDRRRYSEALADLLVAKGIMVVAMAGFATVLDESFFGRFHGPVLNTHPALLPNFRGWNAVRRALEANVKMTGCTVHLATPEVDAGPILAQATVEVVPGDTEESLHERIKAVERVLYPQVISDFLEERFGWQRAQLHTAR